MVLSSVLTGLVGPGENRGFILSKNCENISQMVKTLLVLILFSSISFAESKVNQSLAQVGTLIVTKRDVQILYAMTQIDLNKDNDDSKLKSKKPIKKINLFLPETELTEFLTQAVLDSMVAQESDSFVSKEVSALEVKVNALAVHYEPLLAQDALMGPLKIEYKEIHDLVLRKLKAQSFLKFKTESLVVLVSDEEIKQYFQKNRVKFGSAPLEAVKENIRQYLVTQQIQDKLKEWFEILKRKYKVKYFSVSQDDEKKS